MKAILIWFSIALISYPAFSQLPSTDIFIVNIKMKDNKRIFSEPVKISDRTGYNNQPSFTPDGNALLFSSSTDTLQTDIYQYQFKDSTILQITTTPQSEYSPVMMKDGKSISAVRVDDDKAQRLYKIDPESPFDANSIVQHNDSVAYYGWMNDSTVALCVLNNQTDLQIFTITSQQYIELETSGVGRCIVPFPGTEDICYIKKSSDSTGTIIRYNDASGDRIPVCESLIRSEDFAFMPYGKIWMGRDGKLFEYSESEKNWTELADFSKTMGAFYRIAINPKGNRMALVAYQGKKP